MLDKHLGSAFLDPEPRLAKRLTQLGGPAAKIVVIGMDGAQCINDNTRMAIDQRLQPTVVVDACATFGMDDYRDPMPKIVAEDTHEAALWVVGEHWCKSCDDGRVTE